MRYGPYTMTVARSLAEVLEKKTIPFDVEDNQEKLDEVVQKLKGQDLRFHMPSPDSAFIYFTIADHILTEREVNLAELNLLPTEIEPDFFEEDFPRERKIQRSRSSLKRSVIMAFGGTVVLLIALEMILQEMSR